VHFLARETHSTASVVRKINTILHKEALASQKLFSLFYAVYDPSVKILSYTGSGHVHPIVLRSQEGTVERLHSDGMLIGIEPVQRLRERSALVREGDLVLFFTDGVTDRMNELGESFGDLRLAELLRRCNGKPVEDCMQCILDELDAFTALPYADDMTLILAKVQ
jgi:sigma-B regulation protein RsbU (phosphoserine phosphatase)